jgi:hypothetical protein
MRRLQLLLGIVLAVGAFTAVLFLGQAGQPPLYDVTVVIQEVSAFTPLNEVPTAPDSQSLSAVVAEKYVLAGELDALLAAGAVVVENLHPGQPLLREQVASGAAAEGLSRLAVALDDPDRVILSIPVSQDDLPAIVPGDVAALFFTAGSIQARTLVTETVEGGEPGEALTETVALAAPGEPVTVTTELEMPVAKWIANGIVYRLNREMRENPNYGAPGMEGEPRYIEGAVKSLDVVVQRDAAEWVAFALAHGEVRLGVLPAVTRADVEAGVFPPSDGKTWSDFEDLFFAERGGANR